MQKDRISKLKPAVNKRVLFFVAGAVWLGVGVLLLLWARSWLTDVAVLKRSALATVGLLMGLCVHRFGFSKIARKNVNRIEFMDEKSCIFAFISWKSYLLIMIMAATGSVLRHLPVHKEYLSILYTCIGSALILSSFVYFHVFVNFIKSDAS